MFLFTDTATTEIYTLSLHDALPIWDSVFHQCSQRARELRIMTMADDTPVSGNHEAKTVPRGSRSEEHTSELQSHVNLVCRLLLEQKKISAQSVPHCRRSRPTRSSTR